TGSRPLLSGRWNRLPHPDGHGAAFDEDEVRAVDQAVVYQRLKLAGMADRQVVDAGRLGAEVGDGDVQKTALVVGQRMDVLAGPHHAAHLAQPGLDKVAPQLVP